MLGESVRLGENHVGKLKCTDFTCDPRKNLTRINKFTMSKVYVLWC